MGGRIVDLLSTRHLAAEALIPWLLNDTLLPEERRELETHLQRCASCRDELARQRQVMALYAASPVPEVETNSDAAFAGVMARLTADAPRAVAPRSVNWWSVVARSWRVAFALQMGVIVALGGALGWTLSQTQFAAPTVEDSPAAFKGLAAPSSTASGDAIVVFHPNASEAELRRILQKAGARIVDGPTARNAYVLRFAGREADAGIATLRADGAVLRVETLSAGNR